MAWLWILVFRVSIGCIIPSPNPPANAPHKNSLHTKSQNRNDHNYTSRSNSSRRKSKIITTQAKCEVGKFETRSRQARSNKLHQSIQEPWKHDEIVTRDWMIALTKEVAEWRPSGGAGRRISDHIWVGGRQSHSIGCYFVDDVNFPPPPARACCGHQLLPFVRVSAVWLRVSDADD